MLLAGVTDREQLDRADWRLVVVLNDAVELARRRGFSLEVTGVERSRQRTLELYQAAGQKPPESSVHEANPCRGVDVQPVLNSVSGIDPGEAWARCRELGRELEQLLNARWVYPRGKKVALWHSVSGEHLHIQVPYDELGAKAATPA